MEAAPSEMICYSFWEIACFCEQVVKEMSCFYKAMIVSHLSRRDPDSHKHFCYLLFNATTVQQLGSKEHTSSLSTILVAVAVSLEAEANTK